jgi:hypothetical protein
MFRPRVLSFVVGILAISAGAEGQTQPCLWDLSPSQEFRPASAATGLVFQWENRTRIGSGDDIFVPGKLDNSGRGAVWVFRKTAKGWIESQKLVAPDAATNDYFGVCISAADGWLLVGGKVNAGGAAYAFKLENGSWNFKQKLTGSGGFFGYRLATDGTRAIIGANGEISSPSPVRVYLRTGDTWALEQQLAAPTGGSSYFGTRLNIDGDTAVAHTLFPFRCHVYQRSGSTWNLTQSIADPTFVHGNDTPMTKTRLAVLAVENGVRNIRVYERATEAEPFVNYRVLRHADPSLSLATVVSLAGDKLAVPDSPCPPPGGHQGSFIYDLSVDPPKLTAHTTEPGTQPDCETGPAIHGNDVVVSILRNDGTRSIQSYPIVDCDANGSWDLTEICLNPCKDSDADGALDACDAPPCLADLDQNGSVGGVDLAIVLSKWGTNGFPDYPAADQDSNGIVNGADLAQILGSWGNCP